MVLILFSVSELDLDLQGLDSCGLEGSLYHEVYCGNGLSLEYECDLYLGRESRLSGEMKDHLYAERCEGESPRFLSFLDLLNCGGVVVLLYLYRSPE